MSYLCSFTLLFWMRESYHVPFMISPELMQKAQEAGSGDLEHFTSREAAFIVAITAITLILLLAPYFVFLGATVKVVQHFSIAFAVNHVDKDIMLVLEAENEKAREDASHPISTDLG